MNARRELWDELETSLTSLIASFPLTEIGQRERDLLNEFVENREYGVALEMLDAALFEESIQPSAEQAKEIQRLASLMEIDLGQSRREK